MEVVHRSMGVLKKVDEAIAAIQFEMKRKLKAIKATEAKLELSENEKIKIANEYALMRNINTLINEFTRVINSDLGKMPPADEKLEQAILGAIILEKYAIGEVKHFLKPEHFYRDAHVEIYKACLELGTTPIDMHTVINRLRKTGKIELIGGAEYIVHLTSMVSSAANIQYHSRILVEFAIKRHLIVMASEVHYEAYEDTTDCFEILDKAEAAVNECKEWRKK